MHSKILLARKLEHLNFVRSDARFPPLSLILSFSLGGGEGAYPEKQLVIGPVCLYLRVPCFLNFMAVTTYHCKWFEPRSISSLSSVIVRVSVVLKRTVVVDIE